MDWKKWVFLIGLLVGGTLLLPRGNQGILGIAFYMIAIYSLIDHFQKEMNQYLKVFLSFIGGAVLTLVMTKAFSYFM